jgi:hypothetical protein
MTRATLDFRLPSAEGALLSLADIRDGHAATVVVFTCNHCPYALAWHDRLQRVAGRPVAAPGTRRRARGPSRRRAADQAPGLLH